MNKSVVTPKSQGLSKKGLKGKKGSKRPSFANDLGKICKQRLLGEI
jgi:hypothetical protein